jgi:Ca-activated chloride channel family protein
LLEYYGNQLIQTQVPKIAANGTVKVQLTYTTVLENRGGLVRMQMLNTNPKALMQPLQSASVKVKITSKQSIKNIYSPTHPIKIEEVPDADVMVTWSQQNYMPKHPFVLYYQIAEDEVGASILAHRELGEDGHFMLMLSPTIGQGAGAVTEDKILPKDIVFCVDTSGSMLNGNKMEQARAALKYCVENLRDGDRFNIVDFSTGVRAFKENNLVAVNDQSRAEALKYVQKLSARGGTAIQEALEASLGLLQDDGRLKMIVFATDGFPTIGERQPDAILKGVAKANQKDVRIFVFGEGFDVNTNLLDFLALNHRGEADYVLPDEDIAKKIAAFYDRVGSPIMTDLKLSFEGIEVQDVHPRQIADIFRGEQVVVYGKYSGTGKHRVKLTGNFKGEVREFVYELDFPEYTADDKNAFVPRLWAGKKVDFLLNELRKSGTEDKELVDEITQLAKKFGIVTPYTSYLMAEDIVTQDQAAQQAFLFGGVRRERGLAPGSPAADKMDAVTAAKNAAELRLQAGKGGAGYFYEQAEKELKRQGRDGTALEAIRYVGSRTFYKSGDDWCESDYDPAKVKNLRTVKVGSDEYFKLLDEDARLAKYLAQGNVVLQVKKQWYRFVAE